MVVRAPIRPPVFPSPSLYQIFQFRESRYSCTARLSFLMPRCIPPCAAFLHVSHSFMRCTHPCSPSIHASYSFMRCTYSCVNFVHAHVVSLLSRMSHAAWSLLDLFFSSTCIKSQTSWPECSAKIKTSARADVHKIHCWLPQLLFSLVHIA